MSHRDQSATEGAFAAIGSSPRMKVVEGSRAPVAHSMEGFTFAACAHLAINRQDACGTLPSRDYSPPLGPRSEQNLLRSRAVGPTPPRRSSFIPAKWLGRCSALRSR